MAMKTKAVLGVLGSGGGTNFQSILDNCQPGGILHGLAETRVVISNNSAAGILERARAAKIEALHLSSRTLPEPDKLDRAIKVALRSQDVGLVILAGYMKKLGPCVLAAYPGAIINIHPALDLERFGGNGMYGHFVHEAVIAAGEKTSGATVHFVDQEYDHGQILAQACLEVRAGETPEKLAERVLKLEHLLLPMVIRGWIEKRWG